MSTRPYRKLPGNGIRGAFFSFGITKTRCSLWLGADHLLSVDQQGYREEYKRFYYRDIQAVIARRTRSAGALNVFMIIMLVLFGALVLAAGPNGRIVAGVIAATTLAFLLMNILRGPSCVCHLITAVHTEQLPSLNRLRVARKTVNALRPLIEAAQGTLTPDILAAAAAAPPVLETPPSPVAVPARGRRPIRHESGTIHLGLFTMLIVSGLWQVLEMFERHSAVIILGWIIGTATTGMLVWALIRQIDTDLPVGVRRSAAASLGMIAFGMVIGMSMAVQMLMRMPKQGPEDFDTLRALTQISPLDSMWLSALTTLSALYGIGIGVTGGLLTLRWRRQPEALPPPPPVEA